MSDEKISNPLVYIPKNAKINVDSVPMNPPEVYYENSKKNINIDVVKKIVKGKYGNEQ